MKRISLFLLVLVCLLSAAACALADSLTYALLEDGSGYEITGCNTSARTVTIPARYRGLPVVSVAGEAFLNCDELAEFRTDRNQTVFYTEDGVLFTDQPVKTLVRFPNAYPKNYYQAPADTVAVGPWAFAGQGTLAYLHFQEGLKSFGDHMMDSVKCWAMIFVPDSLKEIGNNLLQNQEGSVSFYGSEDSAFCRYAWDNSIPCGVVMDWEPRERTAALAEPDLTDAEDIPAPRKRVNIPGSEYWERYDLSITYDFSARQGQGDAELRMDLSRAWKAITPDGRGRVAEGMDPRTGLYGIGFTAEETVLRGYDRKGKLTGTRVVNGDFVFSLPDAYSIGLSGGRDTVLTVVPYQPVITASAGKIPLDPEEFHYISEDNRVQYFVVPFPFASVSFDYPYYMNTFSGVPCDVAGNAAENSPHYALMRISFCDPYLLDRANLIALDFDHLDTVYETEGFTCTAASRFNLDEEFGKSLAGVLEKVKAVMSGTYYPADKEINHVTVRVSGEYPTSFESLITLDSGLAEYNEENVVSFAHEMTHAVDQTVGRDMPSTWMEGRAEYISRKVCDTMGIHPWSYEDYGFNWSVLSEEDRADFFLYYTEHANNETYYSVGYFFFKYLCDTYGEDVSAKIMRNLFEAAEAQAESETDTDYGYQIPNDVFKKCVTGATDPDVFQNFIRDVVEKK